MGEKVIVGDRVRCINQLSKHYGGKGKVVDIDYNFIPPISVIFDGDRRIPELAIRYFWENDIEKIAEM